MPDFSIEQTSQGCVIGIDEAGRGPWAGPVVAASVVLQKDNCPKGINDSKKISAKKRREIFIELQQCAQIGVGIANPNEIDELNILQATKLAMKRSLTDIGATPSLVLVDGNHTIDIPYKCQAVIKGDSISMSIAAASIIAKVTRDDIMLELSKEYPEYKWGKNAGYGTKDHIEAIDKYGITPHHRKSFKPIAKHLNKTNAA